MSWLDMPRVDEPEQIDDPSQPIDDLVASMGDVARTNRWFGGTDAIVRHVAALLKDHPERTTIRILDIGTGSADIPLALVEWGRQNGKTITVVAVDNLWNMLAIARANLESETAVSLAQADALSLPFAPGSFDIATCSLAFHHLGFELSARVLAAMDKLTTMGLIVTDLRRDWVSLLTVTLGLNLMRSHRFTQHDGPASVRRAFTIPEYRKIVALSGVNDIRVHTHWYYRVALVKKKCPVDIADGNLL